LSQPQTTWTNLAIFLCFNVISSYSQKLNKSNPFSPIRQECWKNKNIRSDISNMIKIRNFKS